VVVIERPIRDPESGDYYCRIHAPQLFEADKQIYGIDEENSFECAKRFMQSLLQDKILLDHRGRRISMSQLGYSAPEECSSCSTESKMIESHDHKARRAVLVSISRSGADFILQLDDVACQSTTPTLWRQKEAITWKAITEEKINNLDFDDAELKEFGYYILARLHAFWTRGEL
jgi:hypothetical protein